MSTKAKNFITQKILAALFLFLLIVNIPTVDYDMTHLIFAPLCLYLLFTRNVILKMFR